jgi:hypothetical protein
MKDGGENYFLSPTPSSWLTENAVRRLLLK